jgi:hypothetical protein
MRGVMRIIAGLFAFLCGAVVVAVAARYGFKTSDTDTDGYFWGFMYGCVSFCGLFFHALGMRVWRHNKIAGGLIGLGAVLALTISLSNSLGAMAGRGDESQAKRLKIAENVRDTRRGLQRAESEREKLQFTPTDDVAVEAAKRAARSASDAKEAECVKRGPKCKAKEDEETRALGAVTEATKSKALTDQAKALDADIAAARRKLEQAGPVLEANPQGSAFARLFNLPDSKAAFLSTWQNFAMASTVELLIVLAMVAFEVLGNAEMHLEPRTASVAAVSKVSRQGDQKTEAAFPSPQKPRLIASSKTPYGNVLLVMTEIMEPGRGKIELAEAFEAYSQACIEAKKTPVSVGAFSDDLRAMCEEFGIEVKATKDGVFLMKVRLKNKQKALAKV